MLFQGRYVEVVEARYVSGLYYNVVTRGPVPELIQTFPGSDQAALFAAVEDRRRRGEAEARGQQTLF